MKYPYMVMWNDQNSACSFETLEDAQEHVALLQLQKYYIYQLIEDKSE